MLAFQDGEMSVKRSGRGFFVTVVPKKQKKEELIKVNLRIPASQNAEIQDIADETGNSWSETARLLWDAGAKLYRADKKSKK